VLGSLNCGRLYTQATAMSRFYAKPMLLIEFDQVQFKVTPEICKHLKTGYICVRGIECFGFQMSGYSSSFWLLNGN
jgi:ERCC4-type nuclease